MLVRPGDGFRRCRAVARTASAASYQIDPLAADDYERLLTDTFGDEDAVCAGVVHLWSLDIADPDDGNAGGVGRDAPLGLRQRPATGSPTGPLSFRQDARIVAGHAGCSGRHGRASRRRGRAIAAVGSGPRGGNWNIPSWRVGWSTSIPPPTWPRWRPNCSRNWWARTRTTRSPIGATSGWPPGCDEPPRYCRTRCRREAKDDWRSPLPVPSVCGWVRPAVSMPCGTSPALRPSPQPGQVEIEVRATGLNFSDVLKAMGLYPGITDEIVPLGIECAGVVTAVGRRRQAVPRGRRGDGRGAVQLRLARRDRRICAGAQAAARHRRGSRHDPDHVPDRLLRLGPAGPLAARRAGADSRRCRRCRAGGDSDRAANRRRDFRHGRQRRETRFSAVAGRPARVQLAHARFRRRDPRRRRTGRASTSCSTRCPATRSARACRSCGPTVGSWRSARPTSTRTA